MYKKKILHKYFPESESILQKPDKKVNAKAPGEEDSEITRRVKIDDTKRSEETHDKPASEETNNKPESIETNNKPESVETNDKPISVEILINLASVPSHDIPESIETYNKPERKETNNKPESKETNNKPKSIKTKNKPESIETNNKSESILETNDKPASVITGLTIDDTTSVLDVQNQKTVNEQTKPEKQHVPILEFVPTSVIKYSGHFGPSQAVVREAQDGKLKTVVTGNTNQRSQILQQKESGETQEAFSKGYDYEDIRNYVGQTLARPEMRLDQKVIQLEYSQQECSEKNVIDTKRDPCKLSQSNFSKPRGKQKQREIRDEKIAREEGITKYISLHDIINLPMDDFNELIERSRQQERGMTEEQEVCARKLRQKGKNKKTALKFRKNWDARINNLKEEVQIHKRKKRRLENENYDLDEELNMEVRFDSDLTQRILTDLNVDQNIWMLDNDYTKCTVRLKRTPTYVEKVFSQHKNNYQKPQIMLSSRDPTARPSTRVSQVVLEKVSPLQHKYETSHHPPFLPSVSLYPVSPRAQVSLYPVPNSSLHGP